MRDTLTTKEREFVEVYLSDPKADRSVAYKIAYSTLNMSKRAVYAKASRVLNKERVQKAIAKAQHKAEERSVTNASWLLDQYRMIADFNIRKFMVFRDGGAFYDFSQASDEDWYCITEHAEMTFNLAKGDEMVYPLTCVKLRPGVRSAALKAIGEHTDVAAWVRNQVTEQTSNDLIAEAFKDIASRLHI